ncbi:MAG TPA: Hsp20/alpha crystallin family protein [Candidatus Acidoferrales bacterium]|nr:Hsp20/alpha crystallin family protein [Candidatus Acidoferrales bacterium]
MALPSTRSSITGDIDTLFNQLIGDWVFPRYEYSALTVPALDLYEQNGKYVAEMAVPGYKTGDINVEVNANVLTISGKYDETSQKNDAKYHRREIRRGSFSRSIAMPQEIDANSVNADVERGILKVTAAPVKPMAAKKIPVRGE